MKVRIKPTINDNCNSFNVQQKVWYGWETIYITNILDYALKFIKELKQIADVEFIKL